MTQWDLKTVLSLPQYPGEFLHPVVYACTAVMLLCLLASVITYILHQSAIRISRKGRHALLNFCFHAALTFTVFAGGINRTQHPILCQAVLPHQRRGPFHHLWGHSCHKHQKLWHRG